RNERLNPAVWTSAGSRSSSDSDLLWDWRSLVSETPITFTHGLVGCETWKHFVLVETPGEPIQQLLCLDAPHIGFLITEAAAVCPGYRVELTEADEQTSPVATTPRSRSTAPSRCTASRPC